MKADHRKKALTFGGLIVAVYDVCGNRRARGMVWLAVNARVIEFRGLRRFEIFEESRIAGRPGFPKSVF